MVLNRIGNKKRIARKIQKYFPEHKMYIEPFFGAGGMFFRKPKAKYNIVNDLDSDVFNLFQVVMNQKDELEKALIVMPIHENLFLYWKKNKEIDPIKKSLRFLFLSNFGYMGKPDTLKLGKNKIKQIIIKNIDKTFEFMSDVLFSNKDFRKFLKAISFRRQREKEDSFIYCDPPYLGTVDNYSDSFKKQDVIDLFDILQSLSIKFAYSEFDNEFILNEAKKRNLNVNIIGERCNLKNRRVEILITNYENQESFFDLINEGK